MPLIFQSNAGRVTRLREPGIACRASLFTLKPTINFSSELSIVNRVTLSQQVNVQFAHMLGSDVYIYVFGDRIGSLSLSGLSFNCACDNDLVFTPTTGDESGAERIYGWYTANRTSKRREPVLLTLGKVSIEGFVTGFTEEVIDPSTNLVQWSVNLVTLPEER